MNEDRLGECVQECETWWKIIREDTVSKQLDMSLKILSNPKIQNALKKAMMLQLLYFSACGFLFSCGQF